MRLSALSLKNCFINAANKRHYNNVLFSVIAPKYNLATRVLSLGCDQYWKNSLIAKLPDLKPATCLDLACGTGDITFKLAKKYRGAKIYGLDICPNMISKACKYKTDNIEFICKDMAQTDFANTSIDIITGGYALRNASDLPKTLQEIQRILKPNGTLAILDFAKFDNKLAQKLQYYILLFWGYLWGIILHRNHTIYGYIAESLKNFPAKKEFEDLLHTHNLKIAHRKNYFLGTIQILIMERA